jgi:hypothetical protein
VPSFDGPFMFACYVVIILLMLSFLKASIEFGKERNNCPIFCSSIFLLFYNFFVFLPLFTFDCSLCCFIKNKGIFLPFISAIFDHVLLLLMLIGLGKF